MTVAPPAPYADGRLDVGDGHRLYWERCGTPGAAPAVVLHGGPGGGCGASHRALFDPARWDVLLFDQRGCGRSAPHAGDTLAALEANDTARLIGDVEALRAMVGAPRWTVFGGSWGSTLALAYAQAHPDRVGGLVLAGVALTRRCDVDWLYGHAGRLLPQAWAAFRAAASLPADRPPRDGDGLEAVAAYAALLRDPCACDAAAAAWAAWEAAAAGADPRSAPSPRWTDPRFRLGFARIVTHYFAAGAWLADDALLRGAGALADTPGALIHARFDPSAPADGPWALAERWPAARLTWVRGALHSSGEPAMADAIRVATDALASDATAAHRAS